MPNLQNAIKALRQANARALRNSVRTNAVDSMKRQFRKNLEAGKTAEAQTIFVKLGQALDKAAGKGTIKSNTVSRTKSRLALRLNAASKK